MPLATVVVFYPDVGEVANDAGFSEGLKELG
jgi:hypothetical protein